MYTGCNSKYGSNICISISISSITSIIITIYQY